MSVPDLQYALDVLAIQQVVTRYALGQDSHQRGDQEILAQWDDVFTPDGTTDYTASGGPNCHYHELANQMRGLDGARPGRMSGFLGWQHMLSLPTISVEGDTATARTDFIAMHRMDPSVRRDARLDALGAFHDQLVRTELGWRVRHRRLEVYFTDYMTGVPAEQYS